MYILFLDYSPKLSGPVKTCSWAAVWKPSIFPSARLRVRISTECESRRSHPSENIVKTSIHATKNSVLTVRSALARGAVGAIKVTVGAFWVVLVINFVWTPPYVFSSEYPSPWISICIRVVIHGYGDNIVGRRISGLTFYIMKDYDSTRLDSVGICFLLRDKRFVRTTGLLLLWIAIK